MKYSTGGFFSSSSVWLPVGLCVAVLLSRAVFITDGFGSHPDEWQVIRSGVIFWLDGVYLPSRYPGYPFNEIIMGGAALLGGPILCATLTTVVSALAVLFFLRWMHLHALTDPGWLSPALASLALVLHPWFWASGITALDPAWGLALLVAALLAIDTRKYFWAGFASGLAIGFRPSAALWGGVLFLWTIHKNRSLRATIGFVVGGAIPLGVALVLLLSSENYVENTSHLSTSLVINVRKVLIAAWHTIEFFGGIPGIVTLLVIVALRISNIWKYAIKGDFDSVWPLAMICILYLIQIIIVYDKPEYLFPILPFVFLILVRGILWKDWMILSVIFAFSALISVHVGSWPQREKPVFDVKIARGPVLYYVDNIEKQTAQANQLTSHRNEPDVVIRTDLEYEVLQNAYVLGLLRHASLRDRHREERPFLMEFFRTSPDGPLRIREWKWNEYKIKGSYAGLYYPASNTLIIQAGIPDSDRTLLTAAQKWHQASVAWMEQSLRNAIQGHFPKSPGASIIEPPAQSKGNPLCFTNR